MHFTVDTWLALLGVGLGGVAIAVAIPPFIQMLYGRPKLTLSADEFTGDHGKALLITMKNQPVRNRFFKKLGVTREVGEVMASFDVQEQGSGKFVVKDATGRMNCTPTREQAILVRALPAFTVGFPVIHFMDGKALVIDERHLDDLKPLPVGSYTVLATIICGEQIYGVRKDLTVGATAPKTFWV